MLYSIYRHRKLLPVSRRYYQTETSTYRHSDDTSNSTIDDGELSDLNNVSIFLFIVFKFYFSSNLVHSVCLHFIKKKTCMNWKKIMKACSVDKSFFILKRVENGITHFLFLRNKLSKMFDFRKLPTKPWFKLNLWYFWC